ncbi:phosphatase PAP2 family protein [Acidocella sp.]|uniref:phosphatase PAP2 family protein n=1 Tax=Acidocella sp. TaxID=50710 RepID=UPI00262FEC92|nr:phosphatase PAP2 family protein [Acidocella sp.]
MGREGVFALFLAAATVLAVVFLDRPVALYCAGLARWRWVFQGLAAPSLLALPGAGVVLLVAVLRRLRGLGPVGRVWLLMSLAVVVACAAKDELKWVFGRSWPWAWLKAGVYGFRPFSNAIYYGGFPSGHTAYISAPFCVLWVLAPRGRVVWAGVILLVMAGLVGADYHYVGDVLAGLLVGMLCAWGTLLLMRPGA